MKVSGSNPISLTLVVIGALAAITAFLLFTPSPTVQADTFFDVSYEVTYCNTLAPSTMPDDELDGLSGLHRIPHPIACGEIGRGQIQPR